MLQITTTAKEVRTMSTATKTRLPEPSKAHATCAWCRADFASIVELIDHVDHGHLADTAVAA